MYSFRKIGSHGRARIFQHPYFCRGKSKWLTRIKRKTNSSTTAYLPTWQVTATAVSPPSEEREGGPAAAGSPAASISASATPLSSRATEGRSTRRTRRTLSHAGTHTSPPARVMSHPPMSEAQGRGRPPSHRPMHTLTGRFHGWSPEGVDPPSSPREVQSEIAGGGTRAFRSRLDALAHSAMSMDPIETLASLSEWSAHSSPNKVEFPPRSEQEQEEEQEQEQHRQRQRQEQQQGAKGTTSSEQQHRPQQQQQPQLERVEPHVAKSEEASAGNGQESWNQTLRHLSATVQQLQGEVSGLHETVRSQQAMLRQFQSALELARNRNGGDATSSSLPMRGTSGPATTCTDISPPPVVAEKMSTTLVTPTRTTSQAECTPHARGSDESPPGEAVLPATTDEAQRPVRLSDSRPPLSSSPRFQSYESEHRNTPASEASASLAARDRENPPPSASGHPTTSLAGSPSSSGNGRSKRSRGETARSVQEGSKRPRVEEHSTRM